MQFSYQVSEADYKQAQALRMKSAFGNKTLKTIMFWVFILICLMMLWAIVEKINHGSSQDSAPAVTQGDQDSQPQDQPETSITRRLIVNVGPFVLIGGVWFFMLFQMKPRLIQRMYRNDPAMQGVFTIDVTPAGLSYQNTAGFSDRAGWNIYDFWQEGKNVVVLVYKSRPHFIISLGQLSEPQREDLRGILAAALPRK